MGQQLERIGAVYRFLAALVDCLLLGLLNFGTALILSQFLSKKSLEQLADRTGTPEMMHRAWESETIYALLIPCLVCLAYWLIEVIWLASPGKRIFRIYVCNQDGTAPSNGQMLFRTAVKNLALLVLLIAIIAARSSAATAETILGLGALGNIVFFLGLFAIFGFRKQTLYDILARTAVFPQYPYSQAARQRRGTAIIRSAAAVHDNRSTTRAVDELIFK